MRALWRRAAAAFGGFLRGFLGLEADGLRARTPRAARGALERRAAARRSCC